MATRKRRTRAELDRARKRSESAHKQRLRIVHHMTPEQYQAILAAQGGVCALCLRPGVRKRLAVDHDHTLARAICGHPHNESCSRCWRGLVHGRCNSILAYVGDSIEFLKRCIEYLKSPPARGLRWPEGAGKVVGVADDGHGETR